MDDGYIIGHRMTNMESEMFLMCESDRALQKVMDDLDKIACTSFQLSEEEIENIIKRIENEKYEYIIYGSVL